MLSGPGSGRAAQGAGQAQGLSCVTTALFLKDKQCDKHTVCTVAASNSSKPHKALTPSLYQALQVSPTCEWPVSSGTQGSNCSRGLDRGLHPAFDPALRAGRGPSRLPSVPCSSRPPQTTTRPCVLGNKSYIESMVQEKVLTFINGLPQMQPASNSLGR